MKKYINPGRHEWMDILKRPAMDSSDLKEKVQGILDEVRIQGDTAIRKYASLFDGVVPGDLSIQENDFKEAESKLSGELKSAIHLAAENIRTFHSVQTGTPEIMETMPGIRCWRRTVPVDSAGLYIPGGSAPLFSTILMLGIPAQIAGCREVVLCSPPDKEGGLPPAVLYTAQQVGIKRIFKIGGVQAIAAMAYGTETVPRVNKIFGPGNQYVTCAKQLIQQDGISIDMPAGPSEVCVLADDTAIPAFVAADLLSQAEHGADSQVLLVTTDASLVSGIEDELYLQLSFLPRKEIAERALRNSKIIVLQNMEDCIDLVNEYAPEHLIIACRKDEFIAGEIRNAGSVFLGNFSPESAGDYASGTNHTLPTNGYAKAYSGVSVDSFVKKISFQKISKNGLMQIGPSVELMAMAEGLQAHANAVTLRLTSSGAGSEPSL